MPMIQNFHDRPAVPSSGLLSHAGGANAFEPDSPQGRGRRKGVIPWKMRGKSNLLGDLEK